MIKKIDYFYVAVFVSALIHVGIFIYFSHREFVQTHTHGVVEVNFVERVSHEETESKEAEGRPTVRRARKQTQQFSEKPQAQNTAITTDQPQGDPDAVAKESDLFVASITKLVEKSRIYPQSAIDREQEGKVLVAVTLDRSGNILELTLEARCPFQILNDAAVKTVESIKKFPEVPAIIPVPVHLHIPLVFRITHG